MHSFQYTGIPCCFLPTTSSNNTKPSDGNTNTLLDVHDNSIQTIELNPKKQTKLTTQSYIDNPYTYKPTYANYFDFIGANCFILLMVIYILVTVSGICIGGYFTILKGNTFIGENYTIQANCTVKNVFITQKTCVKTTVKKCKSKVEYYISDHTSPCDIGTFFNDTYTETRYDLKSGQTVLCWTNNACDNIKITRSSEYIWWKFIVIVSIFYLVILCNAVFVCFEFFEVLDLDTDMKAPMLCACVGICIIISIMIIGAFIFETSDWIYFGASLIFFIALCVCIGGICVILMQDTFIDSYQNSYNEFVSEFNKFKYGKDNFYMCALNTDQKFDYILSNWVRKYCKNSYICLDVETLIYTYYTFVSRLDNVIDIGGLVLSLRPGVRIDARDTWG
eukprot:409444_1